MKTSLYSIRIITTAFFCLFSSLSNFAMSPEWMAKFKEKQARVNKMKQQLREPQVPLIQPQQPMRPQPQVIQPQQPVIEQKPQPIIQPLPVVQPQIPLKQSKYTPGSLPNLLEKITAAQDLLAKINDSKKLENIKLLVETYIKQANALSTTDDDKNDISLAQGLFESAYEKRDKELTQEKIELLKQTIAQQSEQEEEGEEELPLPQPKKTTIKPLPQELSKLTQAELEIENLLNELARIHPKMIRDFEEKIKTIDRKIVNLKKQQKDTQEWAKKLDYRRITLTNYVIDHTYIPAWQDFVHTAQLNENMALKQKDPAELTKMKQELRKQCNTIKDSQNKDFYTYRQDFTNNKKYQDAVKTAIEAGEALNTLVDRKLQEIEKRNKPQQTSQSELRKKIKERIAKLATINEYDLENERKSIAQEIHTKLGDTANDLKDELNLAYNSRLEALQLERKQKDRAYIKKRIEDLTTINSKKSLFDEWQSIGNRIKEDLKDTDQDLEKELAIQFKLASEKIDNKITELTQKIESEYIPELQAFQKQSNLDLEKARKVDLSSIKAYSELSALNTEERTQKWATLKEKYQSIKSTAEQLPIWKKYKQAYDDSYDAYDEFKKELKYLLEIERATPHIF